MYKDTSQRKNKNTVKDDILTIKSETRKNRSTIKTTINPLDHNKMIRRRFSNRSV